MLSTLLQRCSRFQVVSINRLSCFLLLGCLLLLSNNATAQAPKESFKVAPQCGMEDLVKAARGEGLYDENDKEYQNFVREAIEQYDARALQKTDTDCPNGIVVLPIAFHIFHEGGAVGTGHNWTMAQLNDVIGSLNADFGGYNTNKDLIDECFQDVDAYNTCIQFCMGVVNRIDASTCGACVGGCDYTSMFACSQEPPNDFLNIYSAQFGGGLLGVASSIPFPGNPFGNCIENNDGVYVDWESFTIGAGANAPFDGGKTLTHELGHWLGLYHIGGDGTCANDDGLGDTPTQNGQNGGCPAGQNDCNDGPGDKPDMYFNHMDYSDDACLAMFTQDQAAIMQAVLGYGDITGIPAPAGCRATLACSSQRGNCDNSLLSLDNTPSAANTQSIDITDCSTETSVDLLDIQSAWYGYPTGTTCFNWIEAGGDVSEIGDLEIPVDECGGMETITYNLMMQPWDEENKAWGAEVAGGSVTVNIDCPIVEPVFVTTPCASQNNELSVTCPPCPCVFDNDNMKITVELSGTHSWVSDLAFYLEAPDGTIVTMGSDGAGNCNDGNDFPSLTFMSGASTTYDVCNEVAPINGMFDVDFSMLDGAALGAGWNLLIGDCVGGDTGNLDSYTITISDVGGGSCLTEDLVLTSSDGWPITATDCAAAVTIPLIFAGPGGMDDTPVWTAPDGTMTTGNTVAPVFGGEAMVTYQVQCPCTDPCPKDVVAVLSECVPVELLAFTGKAVNSTVALNWVTASEIDNSHFELERSFDGNKFEVLGKVQGAGTTVETQVYDYIDLSPRTGVNYYRLKQVDFNGAFDYSPTIAIDLAKEKITAEVFPSPASEVLNVRVNKAIATIQIYDITGRTVASYILDGATTTQLDVAKLRSGTYFVSIQSENTRDVVRFIKD